jgi:hypothetical protein
MQLSIHYYVLSLSTDTCRLYEGFRDKLIDINDGNFPFQISKMDRHNSKYVQLQEFFEKTDQKFEFYYTQDPLRLVLAGEKSNMDIFMALNTRQDILNGMIPGDYIATSAHDLGRIVWPVVKEAISGINKNAMRELAVAVEKEKIVSGIDAVGRSAETEQGATLFVEEDYHVKGSIDKTAKSLIISKHVNIWDVIDDVVDLIVEKVLRTGGSVIFLKSGSLTELGRIALIRS